MNSDTPTILIADDEPHILRVISLKLSRAGYRILTAYDGQSAWDILTRERVDLLVTDYQMPKMNGLDLAQRMRQIPQLTDVPVILLTARSFNLAPEDTAGANIISLISKPFSPRELLEKIACLLNKSPVAGGQT